MLLSRASLAFLLSALVVGQLRPSRPPPTRGPRRRTDARPTMSSSPRARAPNCATKSFTASKESLPNGPLQIQQALIREHYLNGEPTGQWDSSTVAAMQKFQADQGWQTKLMPDSRALKKLGLGPDYSNAINANGSSFADPKAASEIPPAQASGFASASGVNR